MMLLIIKKKKTTNKKDDDDHQHRVGYPSVLADSPPRRHVCSLPSDRADRPGTEPHENGYDDSLQRSADEEIQGSRSR